MTATANTTTNAFTDIGISAGSMKTQLSELQKTQLAATSTLPGSIGRPTGDSTGSRSSVDNTFASSLELSGAIAGSLESSGATVGTVRRFLTNKVSPTFTNKLSLDKRPSDPGLDLGDRNVRLPDSKKLSVTEKMRESRESLVGRDDNNYLGNAFPGDLASQAPVYIMLEFHEYTRASAFSKGSLPPGQKIFLPLPENFNQTFNIQADSKDFGTSGAVVKGITNFSLGDTIMNPIDSIVRVGEEATAFAQRNLTTLTAGIGGETADGLAQAITGAVPNPHPTAFFQGLPLRRFSWRWKFVPRSQQEADDLRNVLALIKEKILPKGGAYLKSPDFVQPKVLPEDSNKLDIKFKKCMITQFDINYTGEGTSAFFKDGSPVSVSCGIEFTEMELFLREDI